MRLLDAKRRRRDPAGAGEEEIRRGGAKSLQVEAGLHGWQGELQGHGGDSIFLVEKRDRGGSRVEER